MCRVIFVVGLVCACRGDPIVSDPYFQFEPIEEVAYCDSDDAGERGIKLIGEVFVYNDDGTKDREGDISITTDDTKFRVELSCRAGQPDNIAIAINDGIMVDNETISLTDISKTVKLSADPPVVYNQHRVRLWVGNENNVWLVMRKKENLDGTLDGNFSLRNLVLKLPRRDNDNSKAHVELHLREAEPSS